MQDVECPYDCHPAIKGTPRERLGWALLEPAPPIQAAVAERVAACGPRYVAVHIRRTDHSTVVAPGIA